MTIRELQDLPASLFHGSQLVTDAGNFLCRFFFYLKWSVWQRDTPWKAQWVIKVNSGLCVNSSFQNKTHSSSFFQLNVQNVHQCPKHESKGFSQGWEIFLCSRTKSSFIRQAWPNGYKINTGQHFEAEKGEMSVGIVSFPTILTCHEAGTGWWKVLFMPRRESCHASEHKEPVCAQSSGAKEVFT